VRVGQVELSPTGITAYSKLHRSQTLVAIGLLLAVLALLMPWFAIDFVLNGTREGSLGYGLTAATLFSPPDGYWVVMPYDANACRCANVGGAFQNVMLLAAGGIILLAALWTARMRGLKITDEQLKSLVAAAGLLIVLSPLYLAFALPGAFSVDGHASGGGSTYDSDVGFGKSFAGTNTSTSFGTTISYSWGPTWGWFFALAGGLLILLGAEMSGMPARPTAATAPQTGWNASTPQTWSPGQSPPVPTPPAAPAPSETPRPRRSSR